MSSKQKAKTAAFVKERDEILLAGDIDRMMEFHARNNPSSPAFPSRQVAEISFHKARTALVSLPREIRLISKRWLRERGYSSLDDGDLTDV